MALDSDDKKWIERLVKGVESNLRKELGDKIDNVESSLREEIVYNRNMIKTLQSDLKDIREKLESYNKSRMEDEGAAFSDIQKYIKKIKELEARVKKLEAQQA